MYGYAYDSSGLQDTATGSVSIEYSPHSSSGPTVSFAQVEVGDSVTCSASDRQMVSVSLSISG